MTLVGHLVTVQMCIRVLRGRTHCACVHLPVGASRRGEVLSDVEGEEAETRSRAGNRAAAQRAVVIVAASGMQPHDFAGSSQYIGSTSLSINLSIG